MKSQHCPKDIYFRFIVTLRNDIPIFVVYTMMRKSFSFCYFFRFKIWVTMYIHVWRKFIRRGQSSTQWFSPGRGGGWGRGSVKVCRKGGRCPQARIVNSLHCFCKKLLKKKKTISIVKNVSVTKAKRMFYQEISNSKYTRYQSHHSTPFVLKSTKRPSFFFYPFLFLFEIFITMIKKLKWGIRRLNYITTPLNSDFYI